MLSHKAETLLGVFDLETYVFRISGYKVHPTGDRTQEGTQLLAKGAEQWFKPRACGECSELQFPTQYKFLPFQSFSPRPISKHPEAFGLMLRAPRTEFGPATGGRRPLAARRCPPWVVVSLVWRQQEIPHPLPPARRAPPTCRGAVRVPSTSKRQSAGRDGAMSPDPLPHLT